MIISDASIQFSSEHIAIAQQQQMESLRVWRGQRPAGNLAAVDRKFDSGDNGKHLGQLDRVSFSRKAKIGQPQKALATPVAEDDKPYADLNIRILRTMIQRLTGKVMDIRLPQDVAPRDTVTSDSAVPAPTSEGQNAAAESQTGVGLEYDYYESHYEYESTSFAAQGTITTADGRTVDFNVQLNMTREFMEEQSISIRAGEALKDPLAVNFSGTAAELSQTSFTFDIDMDGRSDQLAFTNPDSGFLALDRNDDGVINDGSELFGPTSGDGFQELAAFDDDGNNWIDENDTIFDRLRIWTRDGAGENQLFSLGEMGIGAIYLNHIDTPFSIKDENNQLLGQVRDTGLFIREDGTVGTMQQIDLAV